MEQVANELTFMTRQNNLPRPNMQQLFKNFGKTNVLVVGDVMIDRYLTGGVERISPEAPVPVMNLKKIENRLGGAANVALNIQALGATPYLCSVVGDDVEGELFIQLMNEHNLSTRHICFSNERQTTVKTRIIANNQHLLRVDSEVTFDLEEKEKSDYLHNIRELLEQKEIHVIIFQDYNKGVLSQEVIQEITLDAIRKDIPTVVDPKNKNFWQYKRATLFKPNLKEIAAKVPFDLTPTFESLKLAAEYTRSKLGNQYTLITLSEKGLFIDGQTQHLLPTQPREIADVCGAGDAVVSVAAVGLASGMSLKDIGILSNLAGGQVCEKIGVVAVDRKQLIKEYKQLKQETEI